MTHRSGLRRRLFHLLTSIAVLGLVLVATPSAASAATGDGVLRHVHSSGRFNVSRRLLEKDLDRFMADTDLVTMTEVHSTSRASALKEPGWERFWQSGHRRGECGMSWRTSAWTLVTGTTAVLTRKTFHTARNDKRKTVGRAASVVLRSVSSGRTVLVSVGHLPTNVERADGRGWSHESPDRVAAYKDAIAGWRRHVRAMVGEQAPDVVLVTGDWNLDLKRSWVRRWLRGKWDDLGITDLTWKAPYPRGGTFVDHLFGRTRRRLIDGTLMSGGSYSWAGHLMHDIRSSDHNPYREAIALP